MSLDSAPKSFTITYLEMTAPPSFGRPPLPLGAATALLAAEDPPVWYFLALYRAVGDAHYWVDMTSRPEEEVAAYLTRPGMTLYTLMRNGWPAGFFLLDEGEEGESDLAYFGLVPEAIGQGLGSWLLRTAVLTAWERPGIERLTVNTNTLDHPRALPLYQRMGFVPIRRVELPFPPPSEP
ncbi:MAG: GNAT family N-acetyltransferase [Pseudomonadota bacterium]